MTDPAADSKERPYRHQNEKWTRSLLPHVGVNRVASNPEVGIPCTDMIAMKSCFQDRTQSLRTKRTFAHVNLGVVQIEVTESVVLAAALRLTNDLPNIVPDKVQSSPASVA